MSNKSYSKVNLFIRSLIFSIFSPLSICLYSFVVVASVLLLCPLHTRHTIIRKFLEFYLAAFKFICHVDYRIEGLENIPKDRTGIIMSKHQSAMETFVLPIIFHNPAVIVKRELLWLPFFGWGLAAADPISINRDNKSSAMQQVITKGRKRLNDGRWILVFPEGTRTRYGSVGHYKLGGARLAEATKHPVIPIAHNAGYFWPRRQFIKIPGTMTLVIGPVIETTGLKADAILDLTKNWIEGTMVRIESLVDKPTR